MTVRNSVLLIRLEDAIRDIFKLYQDRKEGSAQGKIHSFLTEKLPLTIAATKAQRFQDATADFIESLKRGPDTFEGNLRAALAGAYHLAHQYFSALGDAHLLEAETELLATLTKASNSILIDKGLSEKISVFTNYALPHIHDHGNIPNLLSLVRDFAIKELPDVSSGTAEGALRGALNAICDFYEHYENISTELEQHIERSGPQTALATAFQQGVFATLDSTHDLKKLKKETSAFAATIGGSLDVDDWKHIFPLRSELETLTALIPDELDTATQLLLCEAGLREWPVRSSDEILRMMSFNKSIESRSGSLPYEFDLSPTQSSTPRNSQYLSDTHASSTPGNGEYLMNSNASLSDSGESMNTNSSSSNSQPRSFIDKLLGRNPEPLRVEFEQPKDLKMCSKRYPELLERTIELQEQILELQAQLAQMQALQKELRLTKRALDQSERNVEIEKSWKDLQATQTSKEQVRNAKVTQTNTELLSANSALTAKNQALQKEIDDITMTRERLEQQQLENQMRHSQRETELLECLAKMQRKVGDLTGALQLLESQHSSNHTNQITPGFDSLRNEDGSVDAETDEIIERLRVLAIPSDQIEVDTPSRKYSTHSPTH